MEEIKKEEKCGFGHCKVSKDTIIWILSGLLVVTIAVAFSMSLCRRGDGFRKFNPEQRQGQMQKGIERNFGEGRRDGGERMLQREVNNNEQTPPSAVAPQTEQVPTVTPTVN